MKKIKAHKLTKREVKDLHELRIEFAKFEQKFDKEVNLSMSAVTNLKREIIESLSSKGRTKFFVARDENKVLGYVSLSLYPDLPKIGYIGELFVKEKRRSKGAGSLLLEYMAKLVSKKGVSELRLNTYLKNKEAIGFFQKEGFKKQKPKTVLLSKKI